MSEVTSTSLILRLRDSKDDDAWRLFFARYSEWIRNVVRRRGYSTDDAEEVRDRTLAVAAEQLRTFEYERDRGGFRAWLLRIAFSRAADLRRRKRPHRLATAIGLDLQDDEPPASAGLEHQARRDMLRTAFAEARKYVTPLDYQIFVSLVADGEAVRVLADRLDVNENRIYKARSRVLRCVRELVRKGESEP